MPAFSHPSVAHADGLPSQEERANTLVNAFESTRVPVLMAGDSNMSQAGGNHTGGLRNALQDEFGIWGTRMSNSSYGSIASDVYGTYEGFSVGGNIADFRFIESSDATTPIEQDLVDQTTFTQTEFDTAAVRAGNGSYLTQRNVEFPIAFNIGQWSVLPDGQTSPADGSTITGASFDTVSFINVALTGSLSIGATSATLTSSWLLPTKTYQMTFSNGETRQVTLTSGATSVTWTTPLTTAATTVITVQKANGNSIVALGDLRNVPIEAYMSYLIPTGSSGQYNPNVRLAGTLTSISSAYSYATPTNAITDVVIDVPTNSSTAVRSVQANRIGVNNAVGKVYSGNRQYVNPAVTSGAAVSVFYQTGGYGLFDLARDLNWLMDTHPLALREIIRQLMRPLGGEEYLVFWNKFKGNDVNSTYASYAVGELPGTASGPTSNTKEGYKRNLQTVLEIFYDEWVALGYDPDHFWFIDGAYHPQGGTYSVQEDFEDGALELAESMTHPAHSRLLVLRGSTLTTPAEMSALGWYDTGVGGNVSAHLSSAGYFGINEREVQALVDLSEAYVPPSPEPEPEPERTRNRGSGKSGTRKRPQSNSPLLGAIPPSALPASTSVSDSVLVQVSGFIRDLQYGDVGYDVKLLQGILIELNFLPVGNDTGQFGPLTLAAVKAYQTDRNIEPVSGFVGPLTRASLDALFTVSTTGLTSTTTQPVLNTTMFGRDLVLGDIGPEVRDLQKYLNAEGYILAEYGPGSPGNETEIFGPVTKAALVRFQLAHNLSGTGNFDSETRILIENI